MVFASNGRFIKMGSTLRYSLDFENKVPPEVPDRFAAKESADKKKQKAVGVGVVTNVPFDHVVDDRHIIRYEPGVVDSSGRKKLRKGYTGDVVYVEKRTPGDPALELLSGGYMSPLNPMGNPRARPLVLWDLPEDGHVATAVSVSAPDRTHVDVVLTKNGKWKQRRTVRFWTEAVPAVITMIDETVTSPKGATRMMSCRMTDFRQCKGGMVPASVVLVSHSGRRPPIVHEWKSQDLGLAEPTPSDFVVSIADTTAVGGLKSPPAGESRTIDISGVDEQDLGAPAIRGERSGMAKNLLIANGILIGVVVLYFGLRLYRARRLQ
jgi:hypothetical protein